MNFEAFRVKNAISMELHSISNIFGCPNDFFKRNRERVIDHFYLNFLFYQKKLIVPTMTMKK
jgi:hypothetical protein